MNIICGYLVLNCEFFKNDRLPDTLGRFHWFCRDQSHSSHEQDLNNDNHDYLDVYQIRKNYKKSGRKKISKDMKKNYVHCTYIV